MADRSNSGPGSAIIMTIGAFKLLGGVLLAAAGFGIFRLMGRDLGETFEHVIERLHFDPENRLIRTLGTTIGGISPKRLAAIGAGTFFYAILESAEGIGLILRKVWAEYLTILATASLLPLELFEIYRKPTALRILVLVVNLAVLVYLIVRVWKTAPGRQEERGAGWKREDGS